MRALRRTLGVLALLTQLGVATASVAHADHAAECGPPSTTIPGPPPEIIQVGQPMPEEWLRCYIWHDLEGQDFRPQQFGEVLRTWFEGYPVECGNALTEGQGSGTEGIVAEIIATGDEGRQRVRFVYRIQMDGDYINNCAQEIQ